MDDICTVTVFSLFIGVHFLPVRNCVGPAPTRLLRKVDTLFVKKLKQKMCDDPTAPGTYAQT